MLVAWWRPPVKFWLPALNLWSHWQTGWHNFRPCFMILMVHISQVMVKLTWLKGKWTLCDAYLSNQVQSLINLICTSNLGSSSATDPAEGKPFSSIDSWSEGYWWFISDSTCPLRRSFFAWDSSLLAMYLLSINCFLYLSSLIFLLSLCFSCERLGVALY